ncbi:MAG: hypothetical protein HOQ44_24740, partial [Nocardia sp.]|nr:hypothetical protein [Nocardia sp.]
MYRNAISMARRWLTGPAGTRSGLRSMVTAAVITIASTGIAVGPASAAPADPAPAPSAGCSAPRPRPGTEPVLFNSHGLSGVYGRDIPEGVDGPSPVVLDLHGYLEPAFIQYAGTGLGAYGRTHGF